VIFPRIFLRHLDQDWFVFLYHKNINPVLKIPGFQKKKTFVFMHTAKSLKAKKTHIVFFL